MVSAISPHLNVFAISSTSFTTASTVIDPHQHSPSSTSIRPTITDANPAIQPNPPLPPKYFTYSVLNRPIYPSHIQSVKPPISESLPANPFSPVAHLFVPRFNFANLRMRSRINRLRMHPVSTRTDSV